MENSLCGQVFTIVMMKNGNKLDLKQAVGNLSQLWLIHSPSAQVFNNDGYED